MQKAVKLSIAAACLLMISACSYLKFPGVYTLDIQQGNIITQDMVDQLKPGMTKRQVRFVLGTPLITDTFTPDRWDYYYSLKDANGKLTKERLTVFFDEEDKLARFSGDFRAENGDS
ncbi:outer membrane protein assembly factor BamE [Pseudoteredinibacter isoporae]|uniref:Outer membrane protein assembly factor BamE n=1 Tax=Pseudoteredinibacter isoporae TaxID=570281 RepID=A0A7X0MUZ8_9GAMM|nr:outer membrane protein assembly factor BamE [Pseudoteredinibacter isoporae]MBB6521191.1 outer membrane protein assembly factor BamE [Pseudoteredinibacter isoporae]NHO86751.1 outer membrane protein assembly factor BamE [Pseudoteredinibacter isoporae]NIB24797.1 outer membrane protein assembly factor BamE [Pseudoteredinibacter isoporae]